MYICSYIYIVKYIYIYGYGCVYIAPQEALRLVSLLSLVVEASTGSSAGAGRGSNDGRSLRNLSCWPTGKCLQNASGLLGLKLGSGSIPASCEDELCTGGRSLCPTRHAPLQNFSTFAAGRFSARWGPSAQPLAQPGARCKSVGGCGSVRFALCRWSL